MAIPSFYIVAKLAGSLYSRAMSRAVGITTAIAICRATV